MCRVGRYPTHSLTLSQKLTHIAALQAQAYWIRESWPQYYCWQKLEGNLCVMFSS